MLSNLDVARLAMHKSQNPDVRDFANTIQRALHKKSWAVIDRPYSLGCATVGALYERPRCIFCAKPLLCEEGNMLYYGRTATASISTLYAGSANCWICTSVFAGGFDPRYFARTAATSGARNSEMLVT